jgi:hypothetical protein
MDKQDDVIKKELYTLWQFNITMENHFLLQVNHL